MDTAGSSSRFLKIKLKFLGVFSFLWFLFAAVVFVASLGKNFFHSLTDFGYDAAIIFKSFLGILVFLPIVISFQWKEKLESPYQKLSSLNEISRLFLLIGSMPIALFSAYRIFAS